MKEQHKRLAHSLPPLVLSCEGDINDFAHSWWYVTQGFERSAGKQYVIFNREDYPDPPFICLGVRNKNTGKIQYTHCHQFKFDEWED